MKRSNPFNFSDIDSMFGRMSRQFEEMNRQLGSWDSGMGGAHSHGMAVDVSERDDNLVVVADLPGFEREDIDLTVSGQTLTISAERETTTESEDGDEYLRRERRSQSMRRSIRLPVEIDEDSTTATYTNGVLTVTLPTRQSEDVDDSHRIDID